MTREDFIEYCKAFSIRDFKNCFERFYSPDAVFENPEGRHVGKEAVTTFWDAGHEGLHEMLVPRKIFSLKRVELRQNYNLSFYVLKIQNISDENIKKVRPLVLLARLFMILKRVSLHMYEFIVEKCYKDNLRR